MICFNLNYFLKSHIICQQDHFKSKLLVDNECLWVELFKNVLKNGRILSDESEQTKGIQEQTETESVRKGNVSSGHLPLMVPSFNFN